MKKNRLSGFWPVFSYTFRCHIKKPAFLILTFVIGALIVGGLSIAMLLIGKPEEDEAGMQIEKIYICDETGLGLPVYATAAKEDPQLASILFEPVADSKKTAKEKEDEADFLLFTQTESEDGYLLHFIEGKNSKLEKSDIEYLADWMKNVFQSHLYQSSGLSAEGLVQALVPVVSEVIEFNSVEEGKEIVTVLVVMIMMMLLYFLTLIYGQRVSAEVSLEKLSKLVEQLLVSVTPYGLVTGKILAVILTSILQFVFWVGCIFLGLFGGDALCASTYTGYVSPITGFFDQLNGWFGSFAFSPLSILLAVLSALLAIVFYLILAGVAGSMISKPEDTSNMQSIFIFPILISFFLVLYYIVQTEGHAPLFLHMIPFTSAMVTPGAVLIGDISAQMCLVSLLISLLCSILLLWLAAKIFKALLFFAGDKMSLPKAWKLLRMK